MRKDGENRGEKGRAKAGEKTKERGRGRTQLRRVLNSILLCSGKGTGFSYRLTLIAGV
jgi:hypothetical protein